MHMEEVTDRASWENVLTSGAAASFLQSWDWGEFQRTVGALPRRFLIPAADRPGFSPCQMRRAGCHPDFSAGYINGRPAQVFVFQTPLGVFWYAPFVNLNTANYTELMKLARDEGAIFMRVESLSPLPELPAGARPVKHRQPEQSLILDLNKSLDELIGSMRQKTRYNIRLAARKNLIVSWEKNAGIFNELTKVTAKRDKFGAHEPGYYGKMLDCPLAEQATVFLNDEPLTSAIFVGYGKRYTFLHGASADTHREAMAPYLLQWSAINRAKEKGFGEYDFWGVAPDGAARHPLAGVTRFKLGFGGARTTAGPAFEIPIKKPVYALFSLWKLFRREK